MVSCVTAGFTAPGVRVGSGVGLRTGTDCDHCRHHKPDDHRRPPHCRMPFNTTSTSAGPRIVAGNRLRKTICEGGRRQNASRHRSRGISITSRCSEPYCATRSRICKMRSARQAPQLTRRCQPASSPMGSRTTVSFRRLSFVPSGISAGKQENATGTRAGLCKIIQACARLYNKQILHRPWSRSV